MEIKDDVLTSFNIRTRLLLLLGFFVAALGIFSAWTIQVAAGQVSAFIDVEFESVRALSEVRSSVGNARRYEKDIFLNMGDRDGAYSHCDRAGQDAGQAC